MLVIRRRHGESFLIGEDVEVHVLGIEGSQVKFGIRAPVEVRILRREVLENKSANQSAARTGLPPDLARVVQRLRPHPLVKNPQSDSSGH